ncbi:MAG: tetratricopeptide repeat protein [Candidatus Omnitrophica bacterium]|nr:tetratricopeptide repeat protein [Candidatus Omnitrophota bacterium]
MRKKIMNNIDRIVNNKMFAVVAIFIIVLLSRINIFGNQFVMDDHDFIVNWPLIQNWDNFSKFFVDYVPMPRQAGIYSPLKTFFHAINYSLFGLAPYGYHVVSLLIHFTGILFVYKLSLHLSKDNFIAFIAGLFFGVHPLQVEAITYMTASVDMIGIVFLFSAVYYYVLSRDDKGQNLFSSKKYYIALLLSIIAVFTHELAISLPVLLLWYDICLGDKKIALGKKILQLLPFFLIVLFYVFAKYSVLNEITRGAYVYDSFYLTLLIMIKAFAKYVFICFLPVVLTHNHKISEGISSFAFSDFDKAAVLSQSIFDIQIVISLLVLSLILWIAIRSWKDNRLITFCIGWFFISLLPVLNIIPSGVLFGERYMYPGLLGVCLLSGLILRNIYKKDKLNSSITCFWIVMIAVSFFSARSLIRNKEWFDDVSLYESAVKANPDSALMRHDLGLVYSKAGRIDYAINSFQKSVKLKGDDPVTFFSLGNAYQDVGQYKNAIKNFNKAVALDKDFADAYYNLAGIYAFLGLTTSSEENLIKALGLFRKQGRLEQAAELEKAFRDYFNLTEK